MKIQYKKTSKFITPSFLNQQNRPDIIYILWLIYIPRNQP